MPFIVIKEMGTERFHELSEADITIGRSHHNQVKLLAEQASRHHCRIVRSGRRYRIVDGRSSNGTFVNGQRIDEKELADGDSISVGTAALVYRDGEAPAPGKAPAEGVTSNIPLQDRNVQILLQTIVSAASPQDLETFLANAVDNMVEITEAGRGILYTPDDAGKLAPRVARDGDRRPLPQIEGISRSIPQQVFETRKAIYLLDSMNEKEAVESQSVSIYQLRTVMCVPLRVGERVLGVLYVDSHAKAREYSATDLALFEAMAGYLSLTMENLRAGQDAKKRDEEKRKALERENAVLRGALEKRKHLIGEGPAMKAVYDNVRKVAPTDATVLVAGESGTGKEAIAHVLHDLSPRSDKPFVAIDCASVPETLLESELFGYEKGAFTGAVGQKTGKFEVANGGTIFLDEIGELPPTLQVKLLRTLEQRQITRVGGVDGITLDVRMVAATNRNLEEMVRDGKFRQDLYFRLKVVTLTLPPLRDRAEDIPVLSDFFLKEANTANDRTVKGFSEEAKEALKVYRWEGNVRELKHRVEQAVILTSNEYLSTEDLNLSSETGMFRSLETARDLFEKAYLVKALEKLEGNVTRTAKSLCISRQHLQNLIKKYTISRFKDIPE